jgi:multiple sugar transport system ATP-binding protein
VQAAVVDLGDDEGALFVDDQRSLFTARVEGEEMSIRTGSDLELAVDSRRMHFFDPMTGDVVGAGRAAPTSVTQ